MSFTNLERGFQELLRQQSKMIDSEKLEPAFLQIVKILDGLEAHEAIFIATLIYASVAKKLEDKENEN
jgi:hypothetical protein